VLVADVADFSEDFVFRSWSESLLDKKLTGCGDTHSIDDGVENDGGANIVL